MEALEKLASPKADQSPNSAASGTRYNANGIFSCASQHKDFIKSSGCIFAWAGNVVLTGTLPLDYGLGSKNRANSEKRSKTLGQASTVETMI